MTTGPSTTVPPTSTTSSGGDSIPTEITVADESTDTSCNVLFTTESSGDQAPKTGDNLTFNSANGELTATKFIGNVTGNVTGNATGSAGTCTGNAATATALASARTIGGVPFDGTGNINLPGVNTAGNQATSGLAATATALATARNIGGVSFNGTTDIVPSTITVGDESSDTTCFVLFATAASGPLGPKTGSNLTFNSFNGALSVGGDIIAYASDKRLKTNIELIESPLEKINKLSGFTYDWSKEKCEIAGFTPSDEKQIGVFAQDVQEVIPEAVKNAPFDRDDNGESKSGENYLTVQYEKIIPLLIECIKEQQKQIEDLRNIIKS